MLIQRILQLGMVHPKLLLPLASYCSHKKSCPLTKPKKCPDLGGLRTKGPVNPKEISSGLTRALEPGPCRLGFIPEDWFVFFRPLTGVSGPYFLMLGIGNYLASKEILVMEHEFYLGLSVGLVLYIVTTKLGPQLGEYLDKQVDAIANELVQGRKDELELNDQIVAEAEQAKWRAKGQRDLVDAKKENIAMQLEAIHRTRNMMVYDGVRGRLDYHVKRDFVETLIEKKWMINWIVRNVYKSITPELKKQAMDSALRDLAAVANRIE